MSDLVEQLRKNGKDLLHAGAIDVGLPDDGDLMIEAADRIEKLKAQIKEYEIELRNAAGAVEELAFRMHTPNPFTPQFESIVILMRQRIARIASMTGEDDE